MAHRHQVKGTSTYCYSAPIQGAKYEPRAHGGVVHVDRCSCGAERRTNSTGRYHERGPWVSLPSCPADDDLPLVAGHGLVWVDGPFRRVRMVSEGDRARTENGKIVECRRARWVEVAS